MKSYADRTAQARSHRAAAHAEPGHRRVPAAAGVSGRDAAQRQRIESAFGAPAQLVEEEELKQTKADPTAQLLEEDELKQAKAGPAAGAKPAQPEAAPNRTRLPDGLKSGIESLSGMDMSDVRVHANSAEPAQLGALAYAQGNDIHVASGQEQHLPHEAWHVVQQREGRVQPTTQMAGVALNDDAALETEADAMGAKALQTQAVGRVR